jgi:hypothetical protein
MFEKFATTKSATTSTAREELPLTTAFVQAVVDEGYRLAYGALAAAAKILGENTSGQAPGQRGSALVKSLPAHLQPYVCRKGGRYAKGANAKWPEGSPKIADLVGLPVIERTAQDAKDWSADEIVRGAVEIWEASLEADEAADTEE